MLAQEVKQNLANIKTLKMNRNGSKFGQFLRYQSTSMKSVLNKNNDNRVNLYADISEIIVEDPNEAIVEFPITSGIVLEQKLPFFKSITAKLATL